MWLTNGSSGAAGLTQVYSYFTGYFPGYAGYFASEYAPFDYKYYGTIGFVNLKTGRLEALSGDPVPSVSQLLNYADQAN